MWPLCVAHVAQSDGSCATLTGCTPGSDTQCDPEKHTTFEFIIQSETYIYIYGVKHNGPMMYGHDT